MRARDPYWEDVRKFYRTEYGVRMVCYVKRGGWTEIVATGGYSDAPSIHDHTCYNIERDRERELRKALRAHARWVMARERELAS